MLHENDSPYTSVHEQLIHRLGEISTGDELLALIPTSEDRPQKHDLDPDSELARSIAKMTRHPSVDAQEYAEQLDAQARRQGDSTSQLR